MGVVGHDSDPVLDPTQRMQKDHLLTRQIQHASYEPIVPRRDVNAVQGQDLKRTNTAANVKIDTTHEINNTDILIEVENNVEVANESSIITEIQRENALVTE